MYARFRSSVPRLIRQAEKAGVEIRRSNSWDDVRTFYCLHMQTRRRLGVPVQPLRFFRCLWQHVLSQRLGFTLLAFKDQTPIAGGVFLHWHKMLTYKYGASLSEYWQLRPNNLLFWNAIRWGCEQGYQSFDWGRTDLDDEGLRNFKRGWGSEEHIVNYHVVANSSPASQSTRSRVRFVEPLIQHSPVWVGRAIGTLLYGHFG